MNFTKFLFSALIAFSFFISSETFAQSVKIENELIIQSPSLPEIKVNEYQIEVLSKRMGLYLLEFKNAKHANIVLSDLRSKDGITYVDHNHFIEFRDTMPNDPEVQLQWNNTTGNPQNDVNAYQAWDLARGGMTALGDTIVIAVIDDGVNIDHVDLQANIWTNGNEIPDNNIDDDGNGYVDDHRGWNVSSNSGNIIDGDHGTKVSGIIGAVGNNNIGVTGANWKTNLLPVCMGDSATVADVIKSYEYILVQRTLYNNTQGESGAYIVVSNNSFGLKGFRYQSAPFWCDFFDTLGQAGIITVSSAPNEAFDIDAEGDLPTVCPSPYLITVASLSLEGEWMSSGYSREHVDLVAPGERVSTTFPGNVYSTFEGTSAAGSIVSGLIGLLYSVECPDLAELVNIDPALANIQIRDLVLETVDERSFLENKTASGGLVDYYESVLAATRTCDTCSGPDMIDVNSLNDTIVITLLSEFDSLQWLIRTHGELAWDTLSPSPNDTLILPEGISCENLELAFIEYCDSVAGFRSAIFDLSPYKDCQNCMEQYCEPQTLGSTDYWIEQISYPANNAEFYSGNDLGYGNYAGNIFTTYETDDTNYLDINLIRKDTSFSFHAAVWMDVNHNGTFDKNEVVGRTRIPFDTITRIDFSIPFTSLPGNTRMRIAVVPENDSSNITTCIQQEGSIIYEDHCVNIIVKDPMCRTVDSLSVVGATPMTIDIKAIPSLNQEESLNVRYRKLGEEDWEYKTFDMSVFKLLGLEGICTEYEIEMRRVCVFDTSAYTETIIVETECPTASRYASSQALEFYPNPLSHALYLKHSSLIGKSAVVEIFNIHGKMIYRSEFDNIQEGQDLLNGDAANLASGVYLLKLIQNNELYTGKFIKADHR